MKRTFTSGSWKRKKQQEIKGNVNKLPKMDSFLLRRTNSEDTVATTSFTTGTSSTGDIVRGRGQELPISVVNYPRIVTVKVEPLEEYVDSGAAGAYNDDTNDRALSGTTSNDSNPNNARASAEPESEYVEPVTVTVTTETVTVHTVQCVQSDTHIINNDGDSLDTVASAMPTLQSDNEKRLCDVGLWGQLSNDDIAKLVASGATLFQNANGPFEKSRRCYVTKSNNRKIRVCTSSLFTSKKSNGEQYKREWLMYSPTSGKVYCFVCKLFSSSTSSLARGGFCDWRNSCIIHQHENSADHRDALLTYLTRRRACTIAEKLDEQIERDRDYWRHVLQRVIAVICTLAERGLGFRGSDETFGSQGNGNFIGLLELVAKFDPFLASHIEKYGSSGSGKTSYLSKTTCDELIHVMATKVRQSILDEIRVAGYFSLSVDSTPDKSHIDQLTIVLRYVSPVDGKPTERFINFIPIQSHTGQSLANVVLHYLCNDCGIDFTKCRGQSYDNAANMSGRYNGMQQKILEKNKYASYIPCAGHSLNLVGRASVDCCLTAVNFFAILHQLYTFFSASTHRWGLLATGLDGIGAKVPKRLSDTRWEAHADSTEAISQGYNAITDVLCNISEDKTQKGDTRQEASNLRDKMEEFEFAFMLEFWNDVLGRFQKTGKALQEGALALSTCTKLLKSLLDYLNSLRDKFEEIESKAKLRLPDVDYKGVNSRQVVRRRQINDGLAAECSLSPRDKFRVETFLHIVDVLKTNLMKRTIAYEQISDTFSFLTQLNLLHEELIQQSEKLVKSYPMDVDNSIVSELQQFHAYVKINCKKHSDSCIHTHQDLYDILINDGVKSVFPNVEVVLRMFLSLMVTNCSGERSFSQLKRIKNDQRSTMGQDKLSSLSLLCIECDKMRDLNYDDIIQGFAFQKSRNKLL